MNYQHKKCYFCQQKTVQIDYKNSPALKKYLSMDNRIEAKSKTGLCSKHQRLVAKAIKTSRQMGMM